MENLDTQLTKLLIERDNRISENPLKYILPDENITRLDGTILYRRELYPKHLEFLKAGKEYFERAFIGANRVAKTRTGVGEVLMHATGQYPEWWEGRRFETPITVWVCGDRAEAIRDSIQKQMLELMPKGALVGKTSISGIPGAIGQYHIKHVKGWTNIVTVKTYNATRTAFEGAAVHVVLLDEECPIDIYVECLMRIATTKGLVMLTFTPDSGVTPTVEHYLNSKPEEHRFWIMVGWDDIPHMSEQTKQDLLKSIPPHMRDCRTKGIPYLGSGAVYPVPEREIICDPFEIPKHWPRAYGMDVGWSATAAVWGATDPQTQITYIYSDYKMGQQQPIIHAEAIKLRGKWIPGAIDPASAGSNQADGDTLWRKYSQDYGLDLYKANNELEAGIFNVFEALSMGKLKIFSTCVGLLKEYRVYRRNDKGEIANNQDDHELDALRYLYNTLDIQMTEPVINTHTGHQYQSFQGRSKTTGY